MRILCTIFTHDLYTRIFAHSFASLEMRNNLIVNLKDFKITSISIKFINVSSIPNYNQFDSADLYHQIQHPIKHNPTILEFKLLNLM